MRKIYETTKDRKNEVLAASFISEKMCCRVVQNKKLYPADYSFVKDDRLKAIGEIKVRNNKRAKYETFFISADKIAKCQQFSSTFGVKFFLFVWWDDGIHFLDLTDQKPLFLNIGGRFDRGDSQDVEPMAHYSILDFKNMGCPNDTSP